MAYDHKCTQVELYCQRFPHFQDLGIYQAFATINLQLINWKKASCW